MGRTDHSRRPTTPSQSSVDVRADRPDRNRSAGGRIERERPRNDDRDRSGHDGSRGNRNGNWRGDTRSGGSRGGDVYRNNDRNRNNGRNRNHDRNNGGNRNNQGQHRNDNGRYRDNGWSHGNGQHGRYDNRQRYHHSGRVHRAYPYRGGYRVWLTGCQYPFFIPSAYYHRDRFRVGLTIALGGFYNSRGYYDYYDDYDGSYYDSGTSRGELRGVVESVDYRRETFVVRNEATGSFVTVVMRDRGRDPVRAGDYVELGGNWGRGGVFEAYRVDITDSDRDRDTDW